MGHFAKVLEGKVVQVIVAEPDFFTTFVDSSPGTWLQTSYNTRGGIHYDSVTGEPSADQSKSLRKNYAGVGYSYDATLDAFIPPKPPVELMPNPVLDETTCQWVDRTTPVETLP
jgi:hypothetical protein